MGNKKGCKRLSAKIAIKTAREREREHKVKAHKGKKKISGRGERSMVENNAWNKQ